MPDNLEAMAPSLGNLWQQTIAQASGSGMSGGEKLLRGLIGPAGTFGQLEQQEEAMRTGQAVARLASMGLGPDQIMQAMFQGGAVTDPRTMLAMTGQDIDRQRVGVEAFRAGTDLRKYELDAMQADPGYQGRVAGAKAGAEAPYKTPTAIEMPDGSTQYLVPGVGFVGENGQPTRSQSTYEKEADKALAPMYAKQLEESGAQIGKSDATLATMGRFSEIMDKMSGETGVLGPASLGLRKAFASVGLHNVDQLDETGRMEEFRSLALKAALDQRVAGTGAMSDPEFEYYRQIVPGLKNTPAGNKRLIEYATFMAERSKMKALAMQKYYYGEGKQSFQGFPERWAAYTRKNPAPWMNAKEED
jgi:hypothetical protein